MHSSSQERCTARRRSDAQLVAGASGVSVAERCALWSTLSQALLPSAASPTSRSQLTTPSSHAASTSPNSPAPSLRAQRRCGRQLPVVKGAISQARPLGSASQASSPTEFESFQPIPRALAALQSGPCHSEQVHQRCSVSPKGGRRLTVLAIFAGTSSREALAMAPPRASLLEKPERSGRRASNFPGTS